MYSMVLMAALTTGNDVPDFGRRRGGCHGCYGGGYAGCYGGGYGGCYGGRWGGCSGGGGCYGGYVGGWGACYGGYGGGWGCGGMAYGGGYGGMTYGGYGGGYGGSYGSRYAWGSGGSYPTPYAVSWTGIPYASGYGWRSSPYGSWTSGYWNPATGQPYVPSDITGGYDRYGTSAGRAGTNGTAGGGDDRATIVLHVPADATVTVDGQSTTSTGEVRTFHSPPLEPGKTYTYTFDARVGGTNGKKLESKTVEVQAGKKRDVYMTLPEKKNNGDT